MCSSEFVRVIQCTCRSKGAGVVVLQELRCSALPCNAVHGVTQSRTSNTTNLLEKKMYGFRRKKVVLFLEKSDFFELS